ncbi:MAG TPA: calcium-binding protein [Gemmataceae bacterium]|nr:calcium-binding protein [Gemmataceae bacterium]
MAKKRADKDRARLDALIEEATVDCNDEAEAHMGFMNLVEENVVCPFKAKVIGEEVEVVEFRSREVGLGVDAVCRYKGKDYRIDINSLEWPKQKPEGFEWIEAYRAWLASAG